MKSDDTKALRIGWAQAEITPAQTTLLAGQFYARVSEGVRDPLTATAWAIDAGADGAVMVSCDLSCISDELRDGVRAELRGRIGALDPMKVVLNATHTHTAPPIRVSDTGGASGPDYGVELPVMPIASYVEWAAGQIADAVVRAWNSRAPGRIAFGMGYAVVGRNRRVAYVNGASAMYGKTDTPEFDHIEGYEDHSVNVLATYDSAGQLTGLVVNVPCPSQVSENEFLISADYWHEARAELRRRFGQDVFILPQCSAAGDQSPRPLFEKVANTRMLELSARSPREEIAHRIAGAVTQILEVIGPTATGDVPLRHHVETLALPANELKEEHVQVARGEAESWGARYEELKRELEADSARRETPRWYCDVTRAYRRMRWYGAVRERFNQQKSNPTRPAEIHVLRVGDVAFATNPFEYYLDFGIAIKARSKAAQTFLVQLAGNGTYVPSSRSTVGGGYGSMPSSNPVGPEGGRQLCERTIDVITQLWPPAPGG